MNLTLGMIKNAKQAYRTLALLSVIVAVLASSACYGGKPSVKNEQPSNSVSGLIIQIVEMLGRGETEAVEVLRLLSNDKSQQLQNNYFLLERKDYKAVIKVNKKDNSLFVTEVLIYPRAELLIGLSEFVPAFGDWHVIHRSKTSSVRFHYQDAKTKNTVRIFIQTSFPPESKENTILRIKISPGKTGLLQRRSTPLEISSPSRHRLAKFADSNNAMVLGAKWHVLGAL